MAYDAAADADEEDAPLAGRVVVVDTAAERKLNGGDASDRPNGPATNPVVTETVGTMTVSSCVCVCVCGFTSV